MASALSHISLEDLEALNRLALITTPSAQKELSTLIDDLAYSNDSQRMCGKPRWLVVGGKGICERDSYLMIDAILDFPDELQHPVEQVSACVALLRRPSSEMPADLKRTQQQVQRRLSHLLVRYPVLMHNRLVFAVATPRMQWSSLPVAMAEASFAALPRIADGLTAKQLQDFACNHSVKAGLTKPNPHFDRITVSSNGGVGASASGGSDSLNDKSALKVAVSPLWSISAPTSHKATRGGFLTSLLDLSNVSQLFTGRALIAPNVANALNSDLYGALSKVVWDVATNGGHWSATSLDQLRSTLALPSPFAADDSISPSGLRIDQDRSVATATRGEVTETTLLSTHMAFHLDPWLFEAESDSRSTGIAHIGVDRMRTRALRVMSALVELGLVCDMPAAGRWLADATVGPLRLKQRAALPSTTHETMLGFLEALHSHGVAIQPPAEPPAALPSHLRTATETWSTAIEVFSASKAMEGVFAEHEATQRIHEHPARVPGLSAVANARARRRMV